MPPSLSRGRVDSARAHPELKKPSSGPGQVSTGRARPQPDQARDFPSGQHTRRTRSASIGEDVGAGRGSIPASTHSTPPFTTSETTALTDRRIAVGHLAGKRLLPAPRSIPGRTDEPEPEVARGRALDCRPRRVREPFALPRGPLGSGSIPRERVAPVRAECVRMQGQRLASASSRSSSFRSEATTIAPVRSRETSAVALKTSTSAKRTPKGRPRWCLPRPGSLDTGSPPCPASGWFAQRWARGRAAPCPPDVTTRQ